MKMESNLLQADGNTGFITVTHGEFNRKYPDHLDNDINFGRTYVVEPLIGGDN